MSSKTTFVAIAGNPNSGKTTAFNWYTGSRQHVGNYPGITVEKKEGTAHLDGDNIPLVDLPGTYSLTAYSMEEIVARRVLSEERPGAVLNVVNAGVLERNLYLTVQLLEMGIPVVIALNMMDEARAQGIEIDVQRLQKLLGVSVVPTVARTGEGLPDALREAVKVAEGKMGSDWKPLEISYGPDIDEALATMVPVIQQANILTNKYPARWIALKFLEKDEDIMEQAVQTAPEATKQLRLIAHKVAAHLKTTLNSYSEGVIADYRYGYISSLLRQDVVRNTKDLTDRLAKSDKMDQVLTHRVLGPLILMGLLYVMYYATFELGAHPQGWLEAGFEWLGETVTNALPDGLFRSMLVDGIIAGVGGVLGFVPLIMIMFLFITILEDSGYMARVAYMADRLFRFFGLHGASVMPFIISGGIAGGCAIPGIMAARTLRSPRERLATILTAPFMACGAKLPVFLLFVGIFFSEHQASIMFLLTLIGWATALIVARLLRSTIIKGEATPFVMELPPYRIPLIIGVLIHTWERAWQYIKKAGTIILAISILLWAAMTFPSLPEDVAEKFEEQKAPIEEQLAGYPSQKIAEGITKLEEKIAELPKDSAERTVEEEKLAALQETFKGLPFGALQTEITALTKQLEELGEDEELEALTASIAEHSKIIERLNPADSATKKLQEERDRLQAEFEKKPAGRIKAHMESLQEEMDELPESKLKASIAAVGNEETTQALRHSYAGRIGIFMEPVTAPAGFDWRTNIALVAGIAAKEVVVSTLGTAYALGEIDDEDSDSTLADRIKADKGWTKANAVALLLFTLLYSPCFVALAVIKSETGSWKWLFFSLFFNLSLAYAVAVAANQVILRL